MCFSVWKVGPRYERDFSLKIEISPFFSTHPGDDGGFGDILIQITSLDLFHYGCGKFW